MLKSIFYLLGTVTILLGILSFIYGQHDYRLVQLGQMRRDQFLIDQKTGRIWSSVCDGESKGPDCNGAMIWQEQPVIGLNGWIRPDK